MIDNRFLLKIVQALKRYTAAIISVVVILAIILSYFHYKSNEKIRAANNASIHYEYFISALKAGKINELSEEKEIVLRLDPKGIYGGFVLLWQAKRAVEENKITAAAETLRQLEESSSISYLRDLARLRLARVQVQGKNYPAAFQSLDRMEGTTFQPLALELRGDICLEPKAKTKANTVQNCLNSIDEDQARKFYALAGDMLAQIGVKENRILEMKSNELGVKLSKEVK